MLAGFARRRQLARSSFFDEKPGRLSFRPPVYSPSCDLYDKLFPRETELNPPIVKRSNEHLAGDLILANRILHPPRLIESQ
jgi:hypothetical protein